MEAVWELVLEGKKNFLSEYKFLKGKPAFVMCLLFDALLLSIFLGVPESDESASAVLVVQPLELCLGVVYTVHNRKSWTPLVLYLARLVGLVYSYEYWSTLANDVNYFTASFLIFYFFVTPERMNGSRIKSLLISTIFVLPELMTFFITTFSDLSPACEREADVYGLADSPEYNWWWVVFEIFTIFAAELQQDKLARFFWLIDFLATLFFNAYVEFAQDDASERQAHFKHAAAIFELTGGIVLDYVLLKCAYDLYRGRRVRAAHPVDSESDGENDAESGPAATQEHGRSERHSDDSENEGSVDGSSEPLVRDRRDSAGSYGTVALESE